MPIIDSPSGLTRVARRVGIVGAVRSLRRALVTRRDPARVWEHGLSREVAFWERVLPGRLAPGGLYAGGAEGQARTDPEAPISDPVMASLIERGPEPVVSIIDVGAGPLTVVGKTHPGKALKITATDPLADEYDRILRGIGFDPPIRTIAVRGEDLLGHFEPGAFDIAFARNSVDHSIDPAHVIRNMLELVRAGGFVVLWHLPTQADRWRYHGLHQWNFDIEDGAFVIWRTRGERISVDRVLGPAASVDCFEEGGWLGCVLTKRAAAGPAD